MMKEEFTQEELNRVIEAQVSLWEFCMKEYLQKQSHKDDVSNLEKV